MRAGDGGSGRQRAFWLLRSRAQSGALLSTASVVLVIAFLASVMTGLAVRSPDTAVRGTIAREPAAATSLALQAARSSNARAQSSAVADVIRREFRGTSVRTAQTSFVPSASLADGGAALLLVASDALRAQVRIVDGRWPSQKGEALVDAALATAHRLTPGDTLVFAGAASEVRVRVVGIWKPADARAPSWLGLTPGIGGTEGRAIVPDAVAETAGDGTSVQWVITPDADRVTAAQLPRLHSGFAKVMDALSEDSTAAASPFSSTGGALGTVTDMQRSVVALQAVIPVPLTVLAVCSVIALVLLGQLLAGARRVETRLLRSRGMTIAALARASAVESAAIAVVAIAIGVVAAQLVLLGLTGAASAGPAGLLEIAAPPVLTLLASVAAATVTTIVSARTLTDAPGAVEAGRARSAVSAGLAALAVIVAVVTLWRFTVFSSSAALVQGSGGVDPAGVIAPAAVLCAIALVGLSLFGPASAAVERLAGRGRGVAGVLPARQVGRGIGLFAGPVALIVLAVGSLSFAAGYEGTFSGFLRDSTLLVSGAQARADLGVSGSPRSAADLSGAASLGRDGVTASPALVDDGTVGDTDVAVVAADTSALPALTPVGSYLLDTERVASALRGSVALPGAVVRPGTRAIPLRVSAETAGGAAAVSTVTAWLATEAGEAVPVAARPDSAGRVSIAVPDASLVRLVAVDLAVDAPATAVDVRLSVTGLPAPDGGTAASWRAEPAASESAATFRPAGAAQATATSLEGSASVRFVPGAAPPLRLAVTEALAADDSLRVGQSIDVVSPIGGLTGTVAVIVAAVPGTSAERAVLADYAAVTAQLLRTTPSAVRAESVWATGGATARLSERMARTVGPDAVVATDDGTFVSRFLSGAVLSTWLGAAGCAVLALAAVTAAISSALRRRRGEVVVLRAVGLSGRQQAWSRRLEVIGVSVAAAVFGLAGGVVVVLLVGNTLARLSVVTAPSTLSVQGRVDPVGMAAGVAIVAIALAAAIWVYGGAVRRQAADTAYREETR